MGWAGPQRPALLGTCPIFYVHWELHVCACMCTSVCVCVSVHVYVCVHVHSCVHVYECVFVHVCTHVCVHVYECVHMSACMHMCMYVCLHAHMYAGDKELRVCVFLVNWNKTEHQQISLLESYFLVGPGRMGRWYDWIPERYK